MNETGCDLPIQNLPFGTFSVTGRHGAHIGVTIGNKTLARQKVGLVDTDDMNVVMAFESR